MIGFEIIPDYGLFNKEIKFLLGMLFNQAITYIKENCDIKNVHILYSEIAPLSMDLVINLSENGVRLIFDSYSQKLKIIEIYNLRNINLKYKDKCFCGEGIKPSLETIDFAFGPTLPGVFDPNQQIFVLNFRGLSFSFAIDIKYQPRYSQGMGSLQFLEGQTPIATKLCLYNGEDIENINLLPTNPISYEGNSYLEKIETIISANNMVQGLNIVYSTEGDMDTIDSKSSGKLTFEKKLHFRYPAQRVQSYLGIPEKIFYKTEDKMEIHNLPESVSHTSDYSKTTFTDYFYNYFSLGMDILIEGHRHTVKKFILHTNYPGHYDFNIYDRALFDIQLKFPLSNQNLTAHLIPHTGGSKDVSNISTTSQSNETNSIKIDAFTKWDQIKEYLLPPSSSQNDQTFDKPVVLNRASSLNSVNPFGSTRFYGYNNIIFEVMANNHIATVIIFDPSLISTAASL